MGFEAKLSFLRKQRGMTQLELAEKLNVSRQAVSRWESGAATPSAENMIALAQLYGVSLDELMDSGLKSPAAKAEENAAAEEVPKHSGRRIAVGIALAACLLVVIASIITIWSAVSKSLGKPEQAIIRTEDMEQEDIDPVEVQDWTDTTVTIKE